MRLMRPGPNGHLIVVLDLALTEVKCVSRFGDGENLAGKSAPKFVQRAFFERKLRLDLPLPLFCLQGRNSFATE